MKLQWLPEPSSRGGWTEDAAECRSYHYNGFDQYGGLRASVRRVTHRYESTHWEVCSMDNDNYACIAPTKREAMQFAEDGAPKEQSDE